ncbi:MAG: hypothetical protein NPIRA01_33820 [Nitrospirales bacterium]|nr:MAG: hypothetical protein NPIRA01_33820 [Nitrospirales bacterium]
MDKSHWSVNLLWPRHLTEQRIWIRYSDATGQKTIEESELARCGVIVWTILMVWIGES